MRDALHRAERALELLVRGAALLAGAVLFALMLLTVYSVVMRYVFNAPPYFTLDLSKMMLVPAVFFGLAYCGWTGGHIAVDLIGALGAPRLTRWIDAAVRLACVLVLGLTTWMLAGLAVDAREFEEATNLIEIPHHPFVWMMVAGAALYTAALAGLLARAVEGREDPPRS